MTPLYPLFLKLEGKRAVVVGGGPVGAHKAAELARAGALVTVIARVPGDAVRALASGCVAVLMERAFVAGDTAGAGVVIAATGDPAVDDAVAADARAHGALVNVVDRTDASEFYTGAVVRRGPVTVAVGTSGASPALARKVRERLEQVLPPTLGVLAEALGAARPQLLARFPSIAERARVLDSFVERAWFRFVAGPCGDTPHPGPSVGALRERIDAAIADELLGAGARASGTGPPAPPAAAEGHAEPDGANGAGSPA